MAMDKAGSHSDSTSESWGSASCGSSRGMAEMLPTVGTDAKLAAVGRTARVNKANSTVATAMAMMKAKRCRALCHSSPTISASVSPPMVVACRLIWPRCSSRSSAWATRFEKLLW